MNVNKKTYTTAEKAKIALEAIKGDLSMAQISSQYGVHVTQIKAWKAQALESLQNGFDKKPDKIKEQNGVPCVNPRFFRNQRQTLIIINFKSEYFTVNLFCYP